MDARTLTALRGSIKKWEKIVAGTGMDLGVSNCPLCDEFLYANYDRCRGCPVFEATGERLCDSSPYEDWVSHLENGDAFRHLDCPDCVRLATAELDFLRSLLPEDV